MLDESAVLAAMAYVDLNPVRAALCDTLEDSAHTSARRRIRHDETVAGASAAGLTPIAGLHGYGVLRVNPAEYLDLLDWTGRQVRPGKRGAILGPLAKSLARLGHDEAHWPRRVLAVGSDFHRAIGSAVCLMAKAEAMGQRWLHGLGAARRLAIAGR